MSDTNVILLGVGAIGRELLRQLATNHRTSTRQIRICGLVDRSGYVFEPAGLSWRRVMELRALKGTGTSLAQSEGGTACAPEASVAALTRSLAAPFHSRRRHRRRYPAHARGSAATRLRPRAREQASPCRRAGGRSIGSTRSPTRAAVAWRTRRPSARASR